MSVWEALGQSWEVSANLSPYCELLTPPLCCPKRQLGSTSAPITAMWGDCFPTVLPRTGSCSRQELGPRAEYQVKPKKGSVDKRKISEGLCLCSSWQTPTQP